MPNISITGKAIEGDQDFYWLNLYDDKTWAGGEAGGANKVLRTKLGNWIFKAVPDKGVYANDAAGTVVMFFRNFDPTTVKVGDRGQGHAYETARAVDWRVDSL